MAQQDKATFLERARQATSAMSQRTPVVSEPLLDFRGGLNLAEPFSLAPNQVRRADNLMPWRDGRLRRRQGYTRWGTNALGAPSAVTSLFKFNKADGTTFFLASAANGSTWKDAGAGGAWTSLATGLATGVDTHPIWRTYANLAIMAGPGNAPQKFDGTTWAALAGVTADTSPAPVMETHHGRLWLGKGSRVRFSDVSNGESYPANNFLDISINDGEDLQVAIRVQNQLFFAKRTQWFVLMGDAPTTYGWFPRTRPGIIAPNSVQVIDQVAYFLSDDGVYSFDGLKTRKVSWGLDPLFEQAAPGLNLSRLQYAQSIYYPIMRQYWLLVSSPGATTLDTVYVGHIGLLSTDDSERTHLPFTKLPALAMNALGLIQQGGIFRLFSGDGAGKVFQQDDGSTDDGVAITWTLETRELAFQDPDHLKLTQFADLILDDIAAGSMTVTPIPDFGLIALPAITVTLDGPTDPHYQTLSLPGQAQVLRLQLTGSTGFGVRGIIPYARASRGRA